MEKSSFFLVGCHEPEHSLSRHEPETPEGAHAYYCGWNGSGWGIKHRSKSSARDDAQRYPTEREALDAREAARKTPTEKDPPLRVMLTRENTDAEGWSTFIEYP